MEWNFKNGIPIYQQIVDEMTMRIASGSYAPGAKLPSVRDLAMDAGVNPNTMQRALAELERRGLVFSERTSGRFVTKEVAVLRKLHEELARVYFDEFAAKLMKIGMSATEISESIGKWISELPAQKAAE
ncbi:MAG: GntR family transcriptional regulator [Firmicutes bacterium]|jgi:DNA-binding transcriptional regulator YhcF (GntR family)|nr:GntR family transcriptional regulator [Bacillota bacterium]